MLYMWRRGTDMKIAINKCWGGFSVSEEVFKGLGKEWDGYGYLDNEAFGIVHANYDQWRAEPTLIAAIEKVGVEKASGSLAKIRLVDIPDGIEFEINDYDGMESIHEVHSVW
jgi:hypothetical protein